MQLKGLPSTHALAAAAQAYRGGFTRAFLRTYGNHRNCREILQRKFFVPRAAAYSDSQFLQNAAELSVAHHILQSSPADFATDRKMNPGVNRKDVDVYYRIGATKVALEVKCPDEKASAPGEPTLLFAGRHPDPAGIFGELRSVLAGAANLPPALKQLKRAQHKDTKMKDYLVSTHEKFPAAADSDHLTVLLLACGEDLQPWHHYLHEREGLFTPQSFHPVREFARTQVVILSNLKYCHTQAAAHHDWTLRNVFLLPILNPTAESRLTSETLSEGLRIFDHHPTAFSAFDPRSSDPSVPPQIVSAVKLNTYLHAGLGEEEFHRFFPCTERRRQKR